MCEAFFVAFLWTQHYLWGVKLLVVHNIWVEICSLTSGPAISQCEECAYGFHSWEQHCVVSFSAWLRVSSGKHTSQPRQPCRLPIWRCRSNHKMYSRLLSKVLCTFATRCKCIVHVGIATSVMCVCTQSQVAHDSEDVVTIHVPKQAHTWTPWSATDKGGRWCWHPLLAWTFKGYTEDQPSPLLVAKFL